MSADISIQKALSLFASSDDEEFTRGMNVLFRRYVNRPEVWDAFVKYVVDNPTSEIPFALIYYLAHIPWHLDIAWTGDEPITNETREYASELISRFGKSEVVKLLSFIDEERGIERGSMGQSVAAIVLALPGADAILANVSEDISLPEFMRECAAFILESKRRRNITPPEDWRTQAQRLLRGR